MELFLVGSDKRKVYLQCHSGHADLGKHRRCLLFFFLISRFIGASTFFQFIEAVCGVKVAVVLVMAWSSVLSVPVKLCIEVDLVVDDRGSRVKRESTPLEPVHVESMDLIIVVFEAAHLVDEALVDDDEGWVDTASRYIWELPPLFAEDVEGVAV